MQIMFSRLPMPSIWVPSIPVCLKRPSAIDIMMKSKYLYSLTHTNACNLSYIAHQVMSNGLFWSGYIATPAGHSTT